MVEVAGTEVVVDHVEYDPDPEVVRGLDECLQRVWPAVGALDGERHRRVVTPGPVTGELRHRQQLDRAHAQVAQVRKERGGLGQVRHRRALAGAERPHVQFVDHQVIPRGRPVRPVRPGESVFVVHDDVPSGIGHPPCVRVDPLQHLIFPADRVQVPIADGESRDVGRPVAARFGGQRDVLAGQRPVNQSDRDRGRVRRPHPKRCACRSRPRTHLVLIRRHRAPFCRVNGPRRYPIPPRPPRQPRPREADVTARTRSLGSRSHWSPPTGAGRACPRRCRAGRGR